MPSRRFLSVTRRGGDGHPAVAAALALLGELAAKQEQSVVGGEVVGGETAP